MTQWDASQQAVLDRAAERRPDPVLVYGAPGAGLSLIHI